MRYVSVPYRAAVVVLSCVFALGAFAADPEGLPRVSRAEEMAAEAIRDVNPQVLTMLPDKGSHAITGMAFDLPPELVSANAKLTLAARNGKIVAVREVIALPETVSGHVTVAFLNSHPKELEQLRRLVKSRPDTLRFTVSLGEKTIVDVPFAQADAGSANLAEGTKIVGSSRSVNVNIRGAREIAANGMEPDPQCESACNDTYIECYYVICDQRGYCGYCWDDYEYCVNSCPQICVEPKQVYEYGTSWQYSGSTGEYICIQNWYRYILWTHWESRNVYERTVHCDNTYTDVFKRTETRYDGMCKQFHSYGCVGNMYNPPGNC